MVGQRTTAFASAVCNRSSAAYWSPVRAYATRNRACVRATTNSVNSRSTAGSTGAPPRQYHAGGGAQLARVSVGGMRWTAVASPVGDLGIAVDEVGVCRVHF